MAWLALLSLISVTLLLKGVLAAQILAICPALSHSHSLWCYRYMEVLANNGHQITVLGVDEPKITIHNLTKFIDKNIYQSLFTTDLVYDFTEQSKTKLSMIFSDIKIFNEASTKGLIQSKALSELLDHYKKNKKPFDLIIHDNVVGDALLGLVHIFGYPPLVLATTCGSPQWMTFRAGNIFNPAYIPNMVIDGQPILTFYDRLVNTFYYIAIEIYYNFIILPYQDKVMKERFGLDLPYVGDIAKRANIVIVNHHFALDGARPMLPGVVGISGLHIPTPGPLPKDIKEFMDGAKDGVILISFGSNVDSNWLPKDTGKIIVEALQDLPQRVLWKWDQILTDIPPNILIRKWLPQGDMMAHPKLKLFVTHCGLLSTQEALYRKVPVLALPVFFDQADNAAKMVRRKLTIQLDVFNLTSKDLRDGIQEILTNPMYKTNLNQIGELMRDKPMTAQEEALYWTEYAIRHQGAPHLRSVAADLPWYKLLLLDVIFVTATVVISTLWLLKVMVVFCLRKTIIKVKKD